MRTVGAETVYWLRSRLRWGAEVSKNQDVSVAKAKKAIGQPEGLAVLMVFFCECATGRDSDVSPQGEGCFEALVRRFRRALRAIDALPTENRLPLLGAWMSPVAGEDFLALEIAPIGDGREVLHPHRLAGKDGGGPDRPPGRNPEVDFKGEKRSNKTHHSTTDPEGRLFKKGEFTKAKHALHDPRALGEVLRAAVELRPA